MSTSTTLRFSGCQHSAQYTGVPPNAEMSEASTDKAREVTKPAQCLSCSLVYARKKHDGLLQAIDDTVARLQAVYELSVQEEPTRLGRSRECTFRSNSLDFHISKHSDSIRQLWQQVIQNWNGAKRVRNIEGSNTKGRIDDNESKNRIGAEQETKTHVLSIQLEWPRTWPDDIVKLRTT